MSHYRHCPTCESRYKTVFGDLNEEELEWFDRHKKCAIYKKGQVILAEGQYPVGMFCINTGKVKIIKTSENGKEQIIRLDGPGDVLGYRALLSGDPYHVTAITLEESHICFIPKDIFTQLVEHNRKLSLRIIKMLTGQVNDLSHRLTDMAHKSVRERMAETLLIIREAYGYEEDGKTLNASLSREDLASLAGTATETAIRLLSDFKAEKLIDLRGKKISVISPEGLVRVANLEA